MNFGFNDMGFPNDTLEENVALIAEAGYDGIEPTLTTEDVLGDPGELERMATLTAEYGLEVPSVLTSHLWEYPLSSPSDRTRERGVSLATETIEAGAQLGAETVLIVPGVVDDQVPYDVAYENALRSGRELATVAAEHGLALGIENVWNDFLLSPLEFASFVDVLAETGPVGAYIDVGNALRFGNPAQWIDILGDRIEAVHVKDYDTTIDNRNGFTYPLQGDVPWVDVVDALCAIDYDGWVTPEVPPYNAYPESMPGQVLTNLRTIF